jgi:acetolactate synthase-1/2/3 large subunit
VEDKEIGLKSSVARVIVELLKEAGIHHIFGLSGHSIFDITDALYDDPDIQFVPAMHEGSAAYMAAAYAKAKRAPGVCLASSGAGATNLLTGIAYAYKESIPLIALSSEVSGRTAGKGASSWHEIPQREMFEPVTKMSVTLNSESALDSLREAVVRATTGRMGPVYIGIPRDVQNLEVELRAPGWPPKPPSPAAPDSAAIQRVAEALKEATAPVIIAGGGVYWARAEAELKELAEMLGAPFATPPSHKGLLSEEHPLSMGVLGFGEFPFASPFCLESDLVLAVGVTFSEGMTLGYGNKVIPPHAKIVQIDIDPGEIGKIYPVHLSIVGDAQAALRGIIERLEGTAVKEKDSSRLDELAREKQNWREELLSHNYDSAGPINPWHVYRALKEALQKDMIVVGATNEGDLIRRFIAPCYVYHSGEMRAVGSGLSTSIGVSLALRSRPVACVTGDGSFMLETHEIATAAAWNLPISIIVIRNDAYGNMKRDQIRHWGGRVIGTNLHLPDFCTLAASYGIEAQRVERPPELPAAMKRSLTLGRPCLLDVVCPIEGI